MNPHQAQSVTSGVTFRPDYYPKPQRPYTPTGYCNPLDDCTGGIAPGAMVVHATTTSVTYRIPGGAARAWSSPFSRLLDVIETARNHYVYGDGSPPKPDNKGPKQGFPLPPRVLYLSPRKRGGRKRQHRKKR